jgi:hypothetical protein
MQYLNDPRPWTEGVSGELSMVDLVSNETIPVGPAAMLWWAVERGASLLTAGGPSGAGKSTLANACLSFLPDGARAYAVAGRDDPLVVPTGQGATYLLISELSSHGRPHYISGEPARRAFALVRDGLRVVGTLHADSVDEAIEVLGGEVELSREDIARVDLLAVTRVVDELPREEGRRFPRVPRDTPVRRRIVEIGLLGTDAAGGVEPVGLAALSETSGRLEVAEDPAGVAALARWAGVSTAAAEAGIAERADVLTRLAAEGRRDPRDVADAVRRLRARRPTQA